MRPTFRSTCRSVYHLILAALLLVGTTACGTRVPEYAHGIETSYGSISNPNVAKGFNFEGPGTDTYLIPLTEQNYPAADDDPKTASAERIDNAPTRDSLIIAGDVAMTWRYNPATVVEVFKSKRNTSGDIQAAVVFEIANALRDGFRSAVSTMTTDDLIGPNRSAFDTVVKDAVQKKLGARYVVEKIFLRGIHLPEAIANARTRIQAQETALKEAQNQRAVAEAQSEADIAKARGEAESNRLRAQSYAQNPAVLQLEIAKALQNVCAQATTCVLGPSVVGGLSLTGGR